MDGQLFTCSSLSAITYLSYQNLAAQVASDQEQIFNNYVFVFEENKIKCSNYFIWKCVLIISIKCVFIVPPMNQLQSTMTVIGYIYTYICMCIYIFYY